MSLFSVELNRSEDNKLTNALSRMFDDGCETNDSVEQCKQSSSNCVNVVKINLQKIKLNCENILRSHRQTDHRNKLNNRHWQNLIIHTDHWFACTHRFKITPVRRFSS